jgi:hypothetical protein
MAKKAKTRDSTPRKSTSANSVTAPDPNAIETTLKSKLGYDAYYLEWCTSWHICRAQQQINWAKHEFATGWDVLPSEGINLSTEPLHEMKEIERRLASVTPKTPICARELLWICITILSYPEPEDNLGEGPVLEIIKNVKAALEWLPSETRFSDDPD